jgi:hypothetical protein
VPGLRFSILYAPFASDVTERTCSMSAGLAASTVTPGSTAPVASFTTPANALCARAALGNKSTAAITSAARTIRLFLMPSLLER